VHRDTTTHWVVHWEDNTRNVYGAPRTTSGPSGPEILDLLCKGGMGRHCNWPSKSGQTFRIVVAWLGTVAQACSYLGGRDWKD
jgi:hypothetical protein